MKKTNKKGFTIVELVIVIAVIAILAAVLIPTFSNVVEKANKNAALQEARNLYTQIFADDMADGVLDKQYNKAAITGFPTTFDLDTNNVGDYKVTNYEAKNGYKVSYTRTAGWTVADKTN